MARTLKGAWLSLWFCLLSTAGAQQTQIDSDPFGGYEARSIGPAVMGGRIAEVAVAESKPSLSTLPLLLIS